MISTTADRSPLHRSDLMGGMPIWCLCTPRGINADHHAPILLDHLWLTRRLAPAFRTITAFLSAAMSSRCPSGAGWTIYVDTHRTLLLSGCDFQIRVDACRWL